MVCNLCSLDPGNQLLVYRNSLQATLINKNKVILITKNIFFQFVSDLSNRKAKILG